MADARGRAPREDGSHGIHPDALRRSGDRALAMLELANERGDAHRIRIVLDVAIRADLHDLVDPLESLGPAARQRGVASYSASRRRGRSGVRQIATYECSG